MKSILVDTVNQGRLIIFCIADFVTQAAKNFPSFSVLLRKFSDNYRIDGMKFLLLKKILPKECNSLPWIFGNYFLLSFNRTLEE